MRRLPLPLCLALAAALLFRLPPLINAPALSSDAAVVGLQARHFLAGEGADHLWGTTYQAAFDPILAAAIFAVGGARPVCLLLLPLLGLLAMVALVYFTLRRHLGEWSAFAAVLPLVFATMAINMSMLIAVRQTVITVMAVGVFLLDRASSWRRPLPGFALGAMFLALGLYVDAFALVLMPGALAFALAACLDGGPGRRSLAMRAGACAAGAAVGLVPAVLLHHVGGPSQAGLSFDRLAHNSELLWGQCLPFALGDAGLLGEWVAALPLRALFLLGAVAFASGVLFAGAAVFIRKIPWPVRRLGLFGFVCSASALGGFLVSVMPEDLWSVRYLAPIFWTAPFALAPAAWLLGARRFAPALAPYLASAALGGWLSYGTFVSGPLPVLSPRGEAADEAALAGFLRAKGVRYGAANYWLAYRLTFLFGEDPILVPIDLELDRYWRYREAYDAAPNVAWVFHPSQPGSSAEAYQRKLEGEGVAYVRHEVSGFTVLLFSRGGGGP